MIRIYSSFLRVGSHTDLKLLQLLWTVLILNGVSGSLIRSAAPFGSSFTVNMRHEPLSVRAKASSIMLKSSGSKPVYGRERRPITKSLFSELPESLADQKYQQPKLGTLNLALGLGGSMANEQQQQQEHRRPGRPARQQSFDMNVSSEQSGGEEEQQQQDKENDDPSLNLTLGLSGIDAYLQKQKKAQREGGAERKLRSYRKRPRYEPEIRQQHLNSSGPDRLSEQIQNLSIQ